MKEKIFSAIALPFLLMAIVIIAYGIGGLKEVKIAINEFFYNI